MERPRERYSDKIIDALPGYMTVQNRDFLITEANEAFRKDFGDYEGRYCYQVYKHRSEKCEDCPVERTFRDGNGHTSEEIVQTMDGRDVWVLVNTTPVRGDDGNITEVIEMSTDISEMKSLQRKFVESRHRYHQLFEEVPCFISIQDKDLKIVEANRLHREAFGTKYGGKCYEVYKHRTEECYPCIVKDTFKDGEVHVHEEVVADQHGKNMNVLVNTMPLLNALGEVEHVIEMTTNITTIRQLQSELTSTGLLIGSISHGLKGLLNSLDGGFYLVNSGFKKNDMDRVKQGWEMAERNVERIRSLVLDILYYAKKREPEWENIPVKEMVDEVCSIVKPKAEKLDITFENHIGDDTGEFAGDRKAVRSLFVNLLENSIDACRVDSEKDSHKISIRVGNENEFTVFNVEDNGIGMDRETREKAFTLFFSSKGSEGTGLGLFISNKIAQEHGGSIELISEPSEGTKFIVKLPKQPAKGNSGDSK
jgi:PAS domain S-box-containing protein